MGLSIRCAQPPNIDFVPARHRLGPRGELGMTDAVSAGEASSQWEKRGFSLRSAGEQHEGSASGPYAFGVGLPSPAAFCAALGW